MKGCGFAALATVFLVSMLLLIGCSGGGDNSGSVGGTITIYVSSSTGNDSNDGTMEGPLATIQAALLMKSSEEAHSANIHVAKGTYNVTTEQLDFENDEIYGGYSPDFSNRSITTYQTTITDTRTSGEWVNTMSLVNSIMDGFTIEGADVSGSSRAVSIHGNVSFSNNTVYGGDAVGNPGDTQCISMDGQDSTIENCTLYSGDTAVGATTALFIDSVTGETMVEGNDIYTGQGIDCGGIGLQGSDSITIRDNFIYGGYGDFNDGNSGTTGIRINGSKGVVENNTISGGENGNYATGIFIGLASDMFIRNNLLYAGDPTGGSQGMEVSNSSTGYIVNNTIDGGVSDDAYGITLSLGAKPDIRNNIVFISGVSTQYCVYCADTTAYPKALYANDLWSYGGAIYLRFNGSNYPLLEGGSGVNDQSFAGGNIDSDPVFADLDGTDNDVSTIDDNDWHLTAGSPAEVKGGGSTFFNDQFNYDRDDNPRDGAWSIGAYEQD